MTSADKILNELTNANIRYQVVEHPVAYTAEQADRYTANYDFARAKNLFLYDKHHFYLVCLADDKQLDMKKLRQMAGTGRLSFAKDEQLTKVLGVTTGAVSPLNLVNDHHHQVQVIFDRSLCVQSELIGCHPNDNTKTVILPITDLLPLISRWGNRVTVIEL